MTVNILDQDIIVTIIDDDTVRVNLLNPNQQQQSALEFQDEGITLGTIGTVTKVNFVGSSVVATRSGSTVTITISGGGGGTPGGASGTIQYNNAGTFGGFGSWDGTTFSIGALNYSNTSGYLQIGSSAGRLGINVAPSLASVHIVGANGLAPLYVRSFTTADGFQVSADGQTVMGNIDANTALGSSSFRWAGMTSFRARVVGGDLGININNTVVGMLQIGASTTTKAHICFEVGVAPTTPTDGQFWFESNTNTGVKIRINGVTKTVSLV